MGMEHLVRTGLMGVVGRFDGGGFKHYRRDAQVIVRTERGLEFGHVICHLDDGQPSGLPVSGQILRRATSEDRLMLERLDRYRNQAFEACERLIQQRRLRGTLVDVEQTFDGQSIFFYFLGEVSPELESLTDELGKLYERKVRFRKFSETLANGCGPNCGTGDSGCGSSGCGSCASSGGCGVRKKV